MEPVIIQRRQVLFGLGALLAAPAIVHAANLMPVKSYIRPPTEFEIELLQAAEQCGSKLDVSDIRNAAGAWRDRTVMALKSKGFDGNSCTSVLLTSEVKKHTEEVVTYSRPLDISDLVWTKRSTNG